nr:penicillin-binding transpeptidase domain-containing protein [Blautia sp. An46]
MNGKKKKYEKQLRKEEALQKKKQKKAKRRKNREYTIVSYFFVLIFVSLIGYMAYFNIWERDAITSSPYNSRQNQAEDRIVRGSILSSNGQALAYTQVDDQGNETRIYPYGNMFAHVVGYEANGRNGLESLANSSLMSTHHEYVDRLKNEILELKNPGDNVVTTLNTRLQEVAYNALGGYNGAVVVMDPKTGAVLASVSKPDFDPNTVEANWDSLVNDSTNSSLLNRATQGAYPPGSIFKIVTALTYLREHGTLDDFSYNCTGSITQEGHTIPCIYGEVHGQVDFTTAFAESCNTAFVQMGLDLGADAIQETAEDLLFNQELPISLDYRKSTIDLKESEGIPFLMQSSIGQGTTLVSPMHMAMIVSAIANGGELMEPYYIDHVENDAGDVVKTTSPSTYKELMSESEAETLKNLMAEVVNSGTGTQLSGESYSAAGKTGSAEYEGSDGSIQTHSWFVGFSNVEDPDLVVAVIAEGAGTGSKVALPIAHEIFNAYYYG